MALFGRIVIIWLLYLLVKRPHYLYSILEKKCIVCCICIGYIIPNVNLSIGHSTWGDKLGEELRSHSTFPRRRLGFPPGDPKQSPSQRARIQPQIPLFLVQTSQTQFENSQCPVSYEVTIYLACNYFINFVKSSRI